MANITIRTLEKRSYFLSALRASGNVTQAADQAGISRDALYAWRREDSEFERDWLDALAVGIETLEDICIERAKAGSDLLGIFFMKANKPEKYRERSNVELSGPAGGPIVIDDNRAPIGSYLASKLGDDD